MKKKLSLIMLVLIVLSVFWTSTGFGPALASESLDEDPLHQLPATSGKISWFSSEESASPGAWGEWLGESVGTDDATRYWYCAMRWPYYDPGTGFLDLDAKAWWHNKKILVSNPSSGKKVVLAVKDWGPAKKTGRVIDVSSTALDRLGAVTDDVVEIEFADQSAPLGVVATSGVEPNWPAGKPNVPKHPWDGFMDFEDGIDEAIISSTIPGMQFTTTYGIDWRYGDIRTGKYNVYPYGHQGYETNGNCFAWLGVTGNVGRIDFTEGTATYLSVLVSTYSGLKLDAYDVNDNFLATSGWAESNIHTRTFTRLTVEAPGMAYVLIHDTGNYWLIDDLCTDAPGVPSPHYEAAELAKSVVGAPYLWGGKGWDFSNGQFAESETISGTGYTYWNPTIGKLDFGKGLDCSGLVLWAYNKAYGAKKFLGKGNPVTFEGADGQYRNNFKVDVAEDELLPGDVLFFDWDSNGYMDHVAMYVGPNADGNDVIHASSKVEWAKKDELRKLSGFVGFRRLTEPAVAGEFKSHSPIDLIVTDPDGIVITKGIYEVPGLFYYSEWDINRDGELDDMVILSERKIGDYLITAAPEPGASPTDTYTLWVVMDGVIIVLAEDVQVADIPGEGYIIRSTDTGIIQIVPATIDFDPDVLNLKSTGKYVTAYIELASGFDVRQIDVASIRLNGVVPALTKPTAISDYDKDGIPDLMVKFNRAALKSLLTPGNSVITITGLVAGIPFEGSDTVRVTKG